MKPKVLHRTECRLCGSKDLAIVLKYRPSALADSFVKKEGLNEEQAVFPLDLTLCMNCGYTHIPDVIDPEYIYRDYVYVTTSSLGLVDHFRLYADQMFDKLKLKKGDLAMDIGSNDGSLLSFFKAKGMKVLGIEPAVAIAKAATDSGVETLPEFFNYEQAKKIKQEYDTASIITANNIYANIDDLKDFTMGVRYLLAPDGVFVIECSYLADVIDNMVFDYIYHEHLSYFSIKPLDTFFKSLGMELIDIIRVPTKGGSIRITVQLKGGPRKKDPIVDQFLTKEKQIGLDGKDIFMVFDRKILALKEELRGLLDQLKKEGKKIAGYGASATTTTLIYHFELGRDMDFIVDDNPAKQNTYSPGYHIPVYPSDELYGSKPDIVLVLAWRFAQTIMKRHKKFHDIGGRFIIPVPGVKVL